MTTLSQQLRADLTTAMKARDRTAVSVLRSALAAIANAEAVDAAGSAPRRGLFANEATRRHLTEDDVRAVIAAQHEELDLAIAELDRLGERGRAVDLRAQAAVLSRYLTVHPPRSGDGSPANVRFSVSRTGRDGVGAVEGDGPTPRATRT